MEARAKRYVTSFHRLRRVHDVDGGDEDFAKAALDALHEIPVQPLLLETALVAVGLHHGGKPWSQFLGLAMQARAG